MKSISILLNRERGQYPISIASSLSCEGLSNIHPDFQYKGNPLNQFDEVWVNLSTLFRNLYTSVERKQAEQLSVKDLLYGLNEDISYLNEYFKDKGKTIKYYYCSYKDLISTFPLAKIRVPTTTIQCRYDDVLKAVIKAWLKENECLQFNVFVKSDTTSKVGMLTHIPLDLVLHHSFTRLVLIESHTGAVKSSSLWYTKYYQGNKLDPLPFRLDFLQILGDSYLFSPMKKSIKEELLRLAQKYHFTAQTTDERVRRCYGYIDSAQIRLLFTSLRR